MFVVFSLIAVIFIFNFFEKKLKKKGKVHISRCLRVLTFGFYGIAILFITRNYVIDIFKVPSPSMESTLLVGDIIIVNKQFSEKNIKIGDVLVFNISFDSLHKMRIVKRCVGLPGEEIKITEGDLFVDNVPVGYNKGESTYSFVIKDSIRFYNNINQEQVNLKKNPFEENKYIATLSHEEKENFKKTGVIEAITKDNLFPKSEIINGWDRDNYGVYKIPYQGLKIKADNPNIDVYINLIKKYEEHSVVIAGNSFIINGKSSSSYAFKYNYYFMMGDNRDYSMDSRYWGAIPYKIMIGKVSRILINTSNGQSRFFKSIN